MLHNAFWFVSQDSVGFAAVTKIHKNPYDNTAKLISCLQKDPFVSLGALQGSCLLCGVSASILGPFQVITLHSDYSIWRKNGEFPTGISVPLPEVTFAHSSLARASPITSLISKYWGSILFPGALTKKRRTSISNICFKPQKLGTQNWIKPWSQS